MQSIRSFISIPIPAGVTGSASKLIKKLKPLDDGIKWVPMDNFHLTIKFLGNVDNTEVHEVCKHIRSVTDQYSPFQLTFTGTGCLPNPQKPRSLQIGIQDPTGNLVAMVGQLEKILASEMGFKPEPRDYVPHLTLGRTRSNSRRISSDLMDVFEKDSETEFGNMEVDEVNLMASFLDKAGPTYQVMDTVELND